MIHPQAALFAGATGERPFPIIASCEHYAGAEKLIAKALELQARLGTFDVTMDLEDGAAAGQERAHAEMVAHWLHSDANARRRAGVRIHDPSHPTWRQDVDLTVAGAAYVTIPKPASAAQVAEVIAHIHSVKRVAVHVLIETHGALREVQQIAALDGVEVLDFGLMDFVSAHHGAIPASAMRSPGQFEHALIARAKAEIVAAALANGVVPAHNVTLELKDAKVIHADARRARLQFGFLRMWSIHPAQIQPIVDAMAPDFGEVAEACAILLAAQRAEWGPIQHAGGLHDRATYRYYWELVQRARLSGQTLPDDAAAAFFDAPGEGERR